ncbi:phosphatidate cytidylyltransferase [Parasediminibacterium sp. JCM 36343]|uniref:phosphatidate cytidylyltransferase n=1 Tax=Parasediminibacterium sp. JCM 36343 TaxID=3374279 RepID=UPI00397AE08D
MALNIQVFKTRALTALIFVAVMLAGLLWNQWSFFALFSLIHFGCWIEYQKLIALIDPAYKAISSVHRNIIMLLGWGLMLLNASPQLHIGRISLLGIGWYGVMLLTIVFCLNEIVLKKQLNLKVIGYSLLGLLYISVSWSFMLGLYNESITVLGVFDAKAWELPVILIASIWINDTMAYIVGSFIGKTPLSSISPKKTWEGTAGGAVLAIVVVTASCYFLFHIQNIKLLLIVSSTAAIVGTFGDLLESKLKRMAGVKDSGQIMPGHGGFLDRFDSLLLATPVAWVLIELFVAI